MRNRPTKPFFARVWRGIATVFMALIVLGGVATQPVAAQSGALSGYDIMKKANDKPTGNDMIANVTMTITSKTGVVKTREFKMYELKGKAGEFSVLIKFLQPADVKGTSFLTVESADSSKNQYIYLPSLKKTTRIAASDKNKPFMGSDLTYDDFGSRKLDGYSFKLLGEESYGGKPCWKVESVTKDTSSPIRRTVSLVDKESYIIVSADFYDKTDTLFKQMRVKKTEKIEGFWTMIELEMKNLSTGSSTALVFDEVHYNSGLSVSMFSKDALAQ